MEDYEFSKDVELRLEFRVSIEELKRENEELKRENEELHRRIKDKVTLQTLCLAECYERELESWRSWGLAVKAAVEAMPHIEGDDD